MNDWFLFLYLIDKLYLMLITSQRSINKWNDGQNQFLLFWCLDPSPISSMNVRTWHEFNFFFLYVFRINSFKLKFIGSLFIQLRHSEMIKKLFKILSKLIIKIFSFGEKLFFWENCFLLRFKMYFDYSRKKVYPSYVILWINFVFMFIFFFFLNQIRKRSYRLSN